MHPKSIHKYHSHEYIDCTFKQCENQYFDSHNLLLRCDSVHSIKCTSHPLHHVLTTDKPLVHLLTPRWDSSRDRLTVIDSAFELSPGLRREHWQRVPECVDVVVSYGSMSVGNEGLVGVESE